MTNEERYFKSNRELSSGCEDSPTIRNRKRGLALSDRMVRSLEERGLKVRQGEEVLGRLREDALARMPLKSFQAPGKSETK